MCGAQAWFALVAAGSGLASVQIVHGATFNPIWQFDTFDYMNGAGPNATFIHGADGVLYGTTFAGGANSGCFSGADQGCGVFFSLTPPSSPGGAWTEAVLYNFGSNPDDAAYPGGLTKGPDGVLYGMSGGGNATAPAGTVFSMTAPKVAGDSWTETVLYRFGGTPDGAIDLYVNTTLAIDANGVLYGVTYRGGTSPTCGGGCGTVFSLSPPASPGGTWQERIIWNFAGNAGGNGPYAGPVLGPTGTLYGATLYGGPGERGTVFSVTPPAEPGGDWSQALIHAFPAKDKQYPQSLILGPNGVLYGTTNLWKAGSQGGMIFSLTPPISQDSAWAFADLFSFEAEGNHAHVSHQPSGSLLVDQNSGGLYGATGSGSGTGTIFKLLPPPQGESTWTKRVLDHTDVVWPAVAFKEGATLYGVDNTTDLIWSIDF